MVDRGNQPVTWPLGPKNDYIRSWTWLCSWYFLKQLGLNTEDFDIWELVFETSLSMHPQLGGGRVPFLVTWLLVAITACAFWFTSCPVFLYWCLDSHIKGSSILNNPSQSHRLHIGHRAIFFLSKFLLKIKHVHFPLCYTKVKKCRCTPVSAFRANHSCHPGAWF